MDATVDNYPQYDYEHQPMEYIKDASQIKLRHVVTDKALHTHDVRPSVSDLDFQNEVSAYGMAGFSGDLNNDWVVEIVKGDKSDRESSKRLKMLRTHFKLRHLMTGCYLFSHTIKLPEWAFDQQEVTCNKQAVQANSIWYIETASRHPQRECYSDDSYLLIRGFHASLVVPAHPEMVNYQIPGFLAKFWELQKVMWTTNLKLTDRHVYDSRPWSWPILRRGIVSILHAII
ncbi:MIR motif-containing protein [Scleroderma yunnanense]